MTDSQQFLLNATKRITHLNIHLLTDASDGAKDSFRSVWFRHTPQAARYMLFAQLNDGRVKLT